MKTTLLPALLSIALLAGCVVSGPVVVRQPAPVVVRQPAPVVVRQSSPVIVSRPGTVVRTLPRGSRRRVYRGRTYFVNRNVYYRQSSRGFTVVRRPF